MGLGMELEFVVGEHERHLVNFRWSQFSGIGRITVDGKVVRRIFVLLSASTTRRYEFAVGESELHRVKIEKVRRRAFGGFRPQTCQAYVDGTLVAETETG